MWNLWDQGICPYYRGMNCMKYRNLLGPERTVRNRQVSMWRILAVELFHVPLPVYAGERDCGATLGNCHIPQ